MSRSLPQPLCEKRVADRVEQVVLQFFGNALDLQGDRDGLHGFSFRQIDQYRLYRAFAPAFLAAAQRAFASADNFFRAAALIGFRAGAFLAGEAAFVGADLPFCFAQRAFCAAEILARAEALIVRSFGLLAAVAFLEPAGLPGPRRAAWEPSPKRAAIAFSIRLASCLSCATMP
jgi:hypothetical protein